MVIDVKDQEKRKVKQTVINLEEISNKSPYVQVKAPKYK